MLESKNSVLLCTNWLKEFISMESNGKSENSLTELQFWHSWGNGNIWLYYRSRTVMHYFFSLSLILSFKDNNSPFLDLDSDFFWMLLSRMHMDVGLWDSLQRMHEPKPEGRQLLCSCEDTGIPHRNSSCRKRIEMDQRSWPVGV